MSSCLVIIDVQEGFLSEQTSHIPEKVCELLGSGMGFDHVVATKFINREDSAFACLMDWRGLMTEESQAIHPLLLRHVDCIFTKDGYSCFTKEFEEYVENNNIDKLYFLGIDTDCCVLQSASDCFERNIPFAVLINYCASNGGKESHDAAVLVMRRLIGISQISFLP